MKVEGRRVYTFDIAWMDQNPLVVRLVGAVLEQGSRIQQFFVPLSHPARLWSVALLGTGPRTGTDLTHHVRHEAGVISVVVLTLSPSFRGPDIRTGMVQGLGPRGSKYPIFELSGPKYH